MLDENQIQTLVFRAIDQANEVLLEDNALAKQPETILLGEGAALDSMGFINFVVALEMELAGAGLNLNLVEELNASGSQLTTVGDLILFVSNLARLKSSKTDEG